MTREAFDQLVRQVETGIGRDPVALRRRVVRLALQGYAGLFAWLLIVLALAIPLFVLLFFVDLEGKIICGVVAGIIVLGGGWMVLRALLVRVPPPEGHELQRADAPKLFAMLDDLQKRVRSTSFHRVIVIPDCNAAVVQIPRLGVFGWSRNHLLLGLPLMEGLSLAELQAVLAHEFAHLSRDHGRMSHWLYRLRRSWESVFKQLAQPQVQGQVSFRPLAVKFVDWFWPKFNAHAFVLSRADEYEADAVAARVAGARHIATALTRIRFLNRHLEENLWPGIWKLAQEHPTPPADVFARLRTGMVAGPAASDRDRWLAEAFLVRTTNADTHPCLTERLRAVGELERVKITPIQGPAETSAAQELFGAQLDSLRAAVRKYWCKATETVWNNHRGRTAALNRRLDSFAQAVPDPSADADALFDKAMVQVNLGEEAVALPLLRQVVALRPDHREANYQLGRLLLDAGNADGEPILTRLMEADEDAVPAVCALLREHHRLNGRTDKLREVEARLDRYEKDLAASHRERSEAKASDTFIPHGLPLPELQALRDLLTHEPELAQAALVQKHMKFFPRQKFFVLCVRRQPAWHRLPSADRDQALVNRLVRRVRLPGRVLIITKRGSFRAVAAKIFALHGSEIWQRRL